MANENNTISQIKIGDTFYSVRDAQVREVLNNITNNVVSMHNFYFSDWGPSWNLEKNSALASKNGYSTSDRCTLRIYIDTNGKLHNQCLSLVNNQLAWTGGSNETGLIIAGTPSTVNQCAIFLQYRFRVELPHLGYFSSQILRKSIEWTDITTNNPTRPIGAKNFSAQNTTKKTCVKVGDFNSALQSTNYWFDRIAHVDQINGYDYKLGLNDYYQSGTGTAKFTGLCIREILIAQGETIERLSPDPETPSEEEREDDIDPNAE